MLRNIAAALLVLLSAADARAALTISGDVDPAEPLTTSEAWVTPTYIGRLGLGAISADDGSKGIGGEVILGDKPGATGLLTVVGATTQWETLHAFEIGSAGTGIVNLAGGATLGSGGGYIAKRPGSNGNVTIADFGTLWFAGGGQILIGDEGHGTLSIKDGGRVVNFVGGIVGNRSGSTGRLVIDGAESMWNTGSSGMLDVGPSGVGFVDLTNGGTIRGSGRLGERPEGTGNVTVDGSGSIWNGGASVGGYGKGTLTIANGGVVRDFLQHGTIVGREAGSAGQVHVDGVGSQWTAHGELSLGVHGTGSLAITRGGYVFGGGILGREPGSAGFVLVDGEHSAWDASTIYVGEQGQGSLAISNGALVSSHGVEVGGFPGATGEARIEGAGSTWDDRSTSFVVGANSTGTLWIADGGVVNTHGAYIGRSSAAIGQVVVEGPDSRWTGKHYLIVGSLGDGSLTIREGGVVDFSTVVVGASGDGIGDVVVESVGSALTVGQRLVVGQAGAGSVRIAHGGLLSVGGVLGFKSRGGSNGAVRMATGGMLALHGEADDSLAQFLDLINGTDDIRYWDHDAAAWADINMATPGVDYTLEYHAAGSLAGHTVLTVGVVPEPASLALMLLALSIAKIRVRRAATLAGVR